MYKATIYGSRTDCTLVQNSHLVGTLPVFSEERSGSPASGRVVARCKGKKTQEEEDMILDTLLPLIQRKPFPWVDDQPTKDDMDHIFNQRSDEFDRLKLKDTMLADLQTGKATLVTKSGPFAKVLAVVYPDTVIPWKLFGEIFAAFGPPAAGKGPLVNKAKDPWRIVWFAHPKRREIAPGEVPGPEHVNGGYTYPCDNETIVIYREEEVCRVLVHELLHASCTDDHTLDEVDQEAATETWAELFLIAIQAKTSRAAASLWAKQAKWIADQEHLLRTQYNVNNRTSYAWRYTVARRKVLEGLGIYLPPGGLSGSNSMRFTHAGI